MEKRLRNLYEHELFYSDYQMPKIYNFIRGAQAAAPPQPRSQLRHYRGYFFFFNFFFLLLVTKRIWMEKV